MYNIPVYILSTGSLQNHYKIVVSCVYQIFRGKYSQILLLRSKPFFAWPSQILLFSINTSLFDSHCNIMIFAYRVFFCLWLKTNLSVYILETLNAFFVIATFLYWMKSWQWIPQVLFIVKKKTKDSHLQKYSIDAFSSLCLYKIIEINQPMNSNCFHSQENSKKSLTHLLDKQ